MLSGRHAALPVLILLFSSALRAQVIIQTNIPPAVYPGSTLQVEVSINKGNINSFAKYQLDLPVGATATELNSNSGNFSFETGRAKFVWVSLPAEPVINISFQMVCPKNPGNTTINHKFYYVDNNAKKEFEPDPILMKIDPAGTSTTAALVASSNALSISSNSGNASISVKNETKSVTPTPTIPVVETKSVVSNGPASSDGVRYRLQLGALAADPGKAKYAAAGNVDILHEGGFYKVMLGNYENKEEALRKREELLQKGISSFVVAYLNGVRQK